MTIKNGVKHVLESIIVKKTNLANRFADFLLRVLYQKNQLHVSADTRARLLDAILTPQDVSKQYEGNKAFYSLLKFYNARIVILERDSIDKKNEKEYNELKALQAALGKVRLYPDKVVLPSGYTVLKQALLVKDYYRENSLRRKNAQAPENYPELVSRMHSIHPEASIATIEQYEEMMSFFPENEYNKRDLLLRTLLGGKLDELGLRDLTDPDTADKNNIYGHIVSIKAGIEQCPVDFIYDYLLVIPPK